MAQQSAARPLQEYLRHRRAAIVVNEPGVRAGDAGAIHDMRVATRRLRSTLRTYRGVLPDPRRTEGLRDELRWLGDALGAVRDGDVLGEKLAAAVAREPVELVVG